MKKEAHIQQELAFPAAAVLGKKNKDVKRLQEWLSLAGFATAVDKDFGPATKEALTRFQRHQGHVADGVLKAEDWTPLVAPLEAAIQAPTATGFLERLGAVAAQHATLKGREVGGDNHGPWVRLYMRGREGADQYWCAGFVSFLLRQAAKGCTDPLATPWHNYHQVSCDHLAAYGQQQQRFLDQKAAYRAVGQVADALAVAIFLLRKSPTDWTHTGLALATCVDGRTLRFDTVEGNTNSGGSRNGIEVARRIRAGASYDFIRLG